MEENRGAGKVPRVRQNPGYTKGFVLQPKRWVIETFMLSRRNCRDYELATIGILARRMARPVPAGHRDPMAPPIPPKPFRVRLMPPAA